MTYNHASKTGVVVPAVAILWGDVAIVLPAFPNSSKAIEATISGQRTVHARTY